MANKDHVKLIKEGVVAWNNWRSEHPEVKADFQEVDLSGAYLSGANLHETDFSGANLSEANLNITDLSGAYLSGANLINADLSGAYLIKADLSEAYLNGANLFGAHLNGANLCGANLSRANLNGANLSEANLYKADLQNTILVGTDITQANLTGCKIYGISAWGLKGIPNGQSGLTITPHGEPKITVEDLRVAQFIYFLLNNKNVRDVIDTITSKVILILGRFKDDRKEILDAIRKELRKYNFVPILFDFDKPVSKDVTGTVETLARLSRFIIADLTDPSSIPHELAIVIPYLRTTPILPIKLRGAEGYSMFEDLQRDLPHRVLETYEYENSTSLIAALPQVIAPVNERAESFRRQS